MKNIIFKYTAFTIFFIAFNTSAAVSEKEADELGRSLTPVGAEMKGNAAGTIPDWTGGLPVDAGAIDAKGFLADPFSSEKPLFTITFSNYEQYQNQLTAGQVAMFKRYSETYKIPVYKTHRTAALPDEVYAGIKINALEAKTINDGYGLEGFSSRNSYAFPIPDNGIEVIWNHMTRYMGGTIRRIITQATPQVNGSFTPIRFEDYIATPYFMTGLDPEKSANTLGYFKQEVTAPSRMAGNVLLVHDTLDQLKEPRMAWVYNAGQRRVRRAPQVEYDGPGTAADGLRTSDNFDMFSGSPDQYNWELIGKKEMYIPYNSYQLDSPQLKYADIIKPGHLNQDYTRYELHRVWEVVATLRSGKRNIYAKRHMYFNEDTWQISAIDHYDGRGQLWRVSEGHPQQYYHVKVPAYTVEVIYDLIAGRYLALGMKNEERKSFEFGVPAKADDFTPSALRSAGVR